MEGAMKALVLTLMMSVLMFTSTAQADYSVIDIRVGVSGNQMYPDIDGDIVVWQDDVNGASDIDIYWKHFGDPNDPNTFDLSANEEIPAVSSNVIVYQDKYSSTRDIRAYDLSSLSPISLPGIHYEDGVNQKNPDVSGNYIVYEHLAGSVYNVYVYDRGLSSCEAVTVASTHQIRPAVSGNLVVWMDGRDDGYAGYDIYMCDVSVKPYAPVPVYASEGDQWNPAVSGDLIVWEELGSGTVTLVAYDRSINGIIWTHVVSAVNAYPAVSNGIIVWQEEGTSATDYNIRGYDTTTGAYLDIATANQDDRNPAISGRRVVWQRNGTDIVGAVIPSPTVIQVDTPSADEMFLAGSQIVISWQLAEGTPPDFVDIAYTVNNGSSWQVIAEDISFSDGGYLWDPIADVNAVDSCQIRISDASDSATSGISGLFTIFQCDPKLTADLTGDCLVNMADVAELAGQWLLCGNLRDPDWCLSN
jgi:beta propeller repeat protein